MGKPLKKMLKWICGYPAARCGTSYQSQRCCHECSRMSKCLLRCENHPEKCGALVRDLDQVQEQKAK